MKFYQLDVKTAFLNSNLELEIYVRQPKHFEDKTFPGYLWRLKKALYGRKQASRECWKTVHQFLETHNFKALKTDTCIYQLILPNGTIILLAHYVDDILGTGSVDNKVSKFITSF